jgi:hypothetical protein
MNVTRSSAGTPPPAFLLTLVEWLVGGHTLDEFLDNFPSVTREQAVAFIQQGTKAKLSELSIRERPTCGSRLNL